MALIDSTYFVRNLFVPNVKRTSKPPAGVANAAMLATSESNLEDYIVKYEADFLKKVFGKQFASYLVEHLNDDNIEDRIKAIKVLLIDDNTKVSPIANYIYFYWKRDNLTQTTSAGSEVIGKIDDAVLVSTRRSLSIAWNEMSDMIREIYSHMNEYCDDYVEFDMSDINEGMTKKINEFNIV